MEGESLLKTPNGEKEEKFRYCRQVGNTMLHVIARKESLAIKFI